LTFLFTLGLLMIFSRVTQVMPEGLFSGLISIIGYGLATLFTVAFVSAVSTLVTGGITYYLVLAVLLISRTIVLKARLARPL